MENEEKLIRLLIVDEGLHKAEQITSSLRVAGLHVRAEFAEDADDMVEMLAGKTLDLVLFSLDLPDFALDRARQLIRESGRHLALIAMGRKVDSAVVAEAIKAGAQDAVPDDSLDHLALVVDREARNISLWRRANRLELEYQESEKRCQNLLSNSKDAVAYVHEGMHLYANRVYLDLFGNADFNELEGVSLIDMVDTPQQGQLKTFLRQLSKNENDSKELELDLIHSSGEKVSATLEFSRASYDGEPCTQILIRSPADTSELEEQINYLHQHDLVTGLYNRQYLMDALKTSITEAINGLHQSHLIYIAIDNFQSIRDLVGISGCDTLISDIATILEDNAASGDIVARFGAYTYVCLGRVENKSVTEKFASRVNQLVEQHISEIGNQSISATCSAAIVFIDENSPDNSNEIVSRAERACEDLQTQGGNQTTVYVPKAGEMTQEEEDGITADLIRDALNNSRIKALFQPVVGIKAQEGERYSTSAELRSEEGYVLETENFLPAAERTGTAKMLDRWQILHTIRKINETGNQGRRIEFFVPLSGDSIRDTALPVWVSENISKVGINGEQMIFMIDEAHAVNQLKAVKILATALQQLHCKIAIDNFGTGLNPFQLVKHVDADYVRINPVYMEALAQNEENQKSLTELAYQAMDLGVSTITPGVTDAAVLSVLWTLNIDFVQGVFLQAPQHELNYDFSSM